MNNSPSPGPGSMVRSPTEPIQRRPTPQQNGALGPPSRSYTSDRPSTGHGDPQERMRGGGPAASSPNSIGPGRSTSSHTHRQQMTPQMMEQQLSEHHRVLKNYIQQSVRDDKTTMPHNRARDKLLKLSPIQFQELSTDVYDELVRREDERRAQDGHPPPRPVPRYLPEKPSFHPKRNQARQKLSTLQLRKFRELATDVLVELERRYPKFAGRGGPIPMRDPYSRPGTSNSMRADGRNRAMSNESASGPFSPGGYASGGSNADFGRQILGAKAAQSNTMVPNKGTMVEDDGESVDDVYDLDERMTSSSSRRTTNKSFGQGAHQHAERVSELEARLAELEVQLQQKTQAIETEKSKAREVTAEMEQQLSTVEDQNEALEAQIQQLRNENSKASKFDSGWQQKYEAVEAQLQAQNEQLRDQESQLHEQEDQIQQHENQLQQQEEQLQEKDGQIQQQESQIQEQENQLHQQSVQLQQKDGQLSQHSSQLQRLEKQLSDRQAEIDDHKDHLQEKDDVLRQYQAKFDEHETTMHEQNMRLHEQETQLNMKSASNDDSGEWQEKYSEIDAQLRKQREVTEQVRKDAMRSLKEMRDLSAQSTAGSQNEERLQKQVEELQNAVKSWKDKYASVHSQLRQGRANSVGLIHSPASSTYSAINPSESLNSTAAPPFTDSSGLIRSSSITNFQVSIDELLRVARVEKPSAALDFMHTIVTNVRCITSDIDAATKNIKESEDDKEKRTKIKQKVSAATNNLITCSKKRAQSNGMAPVGLIDAAAQHLVTAVVALAKVSKVRPGTAGENEGEDFA